jgi:ketohexokinase
MQMVASSLPDVNIDHCIYREDSTEAASSYIIRSEATGSRTIVNYNELSEMSFEEFTQLVKELELDGEQGKNDWWHFEVGFSPLKSLTTYNGSLPVYFLCPPNKFAPLC